jgi:endopolyphosphatase
MPQLTAVIVNLNREVNSLNGSGISRLAVNTRVQLTEYRKRGVKAYMTGHVPPGRKFYYPSCFRRYTIWSHLFRDVILGHFYGHNNMDHFFFLDAKQAFEEEEEAELLKRINNNYEFDELSPEELTVLARLSTHSPSNLLDSDHNFKALGAEEYLSDLKDMFADIKAPPKPHKWKGKKDRQKWEKKVREYEENYQVVQVAPSIIPAYYSAIRVFEYNVSELAGVQFRRGNQEPTFRTNWTEWWADMDRQIEEERLLELEDLHQDMSSDSTFTIQDVDSSDAVMSPDEFRSSRRRRKSRHPNDHATRKSIKHPPGFRIPPGPHKSAPRGPVYESQLFTPLRWEVHFVNLTEINDLFEENPKRSWNYGKEFYQMEYTSDAAPYNLKDLTVGTWLELGRKIGKDKQIKKKTGLDLGGTEIGEFDVEYLDGEDWDGYPVNEDETSDSDSDDISVAKKGKKKKGKGKKGKKEKGSGETFWDIFLRRAFVNSGHEYQLDFD